MFWLLAILGFIILIFIFIFVPETYREDDNNDNDHKLPTPNTTTSSTKKKIINPFASLILFRYPNLSIIMTHISIFLSLIYTQATLIPKEFNDIYHLSSFHIGLVFLSSAVGYMFGSVIGGKYADYVVRKAKRSVLTAQ